MEVGAHSLCYGATMEMYIAGVSPLIVMIIVIFKSDSFLLYIRNQVAQFSTKLSDKMLQNKEFFTVPDFDRTIQEVTNGYFPSSLSTSDIDKENVLPK